MNLPKVTIVTVVYNAVDIIEDTILSVIHQNYPYIEYIVIDGGSNDGTIELIKKYEKNIDYWISEKDRGIYDAMNKGIKYASGDFINFMNAGDLFINTSTVKEVFSIAPDNAEMIYGHQKIRYNSFSKTRKAKPLDDLWKWTVFNHQSLFAKTQLLKEEPFKIDYPIAADFYFFYSQYKKDRIFFNTDIFICNSLPGGVSDTQAIKGYKEVWNIVKLWDNNLKINWHHKNLIYKQSLIMMLRKIIPFFLFERLMNLKNKLFPS